MGPVAQRLIDQAHNHRNQEAVKQRDLYRDRSRVMWHWICADETRKQEFEDYIKRTGEPFDESAV